MDLQDTHTEEKVAEMIVSSVLSLLGVDWMLESNPIDDDDRLTIMRDYIRSITWGIIHFCNRNDLMIEYEVFQIIHSLEIRPIGPQSLFMLRCHLWEVRSRIFRTDLDLEEKTIFFITLVALLSNWCLQSNQESYVIEGIKMVSFVLCTYFSGPVDLTLSQLSNYAMEYASREHVMD